VRLLALFLGSALILSPAPATEAFPKELAGELEAVLARYAAAVPAQHEAMLGVEMVAEYEARFTELHEQGRWRLRRTISKLGEVAFRPINAFVGDDRVRKELILRTMEEEQKEKAYGAISVTPADYKFTINAILKRNSRKIYAFDVTPRRKAPGLFEGTVEIDGETGMPLRESGRLVKSPHWILSNVRFSRDYELRSGIAVVKYFESRANVRFLGIGPAEIIARYSDYQPAEEQPARERAL
jgi:hypothetical protein